MNKPMTVVTQEQALKESHGRPKPPSMPSAEKMLEFCNNVQTTWLNTGVDQKVLQGSDEFYVAALMGTVGGESFVPVMTGMFMTEELIASLSRPTRALVIGSPISILTISQVSETVITPNNLQTKLMSEFLDVSNVSNIETTTYEAILNKELEFDYAQGLFHMITCDYDLLHAILDVLPSGRPLVISNSGNGGELYTGLDDSFSHLVHQEIINRNDCYVYHLPGFLAETICIKK